MINRCLAWLDIAKPSTHLPYFMPFTLSPIQRFAKGITLLAFTTMPLVAQALPADMGTFTITSQNPSAGSASGTYTAAKSDGLGLGATGTFTIARNETNGYAGMEFTDGNNGIMIRNLVKQGTLADDRDKFSYTITLTPTDANSIHSIKIGQTSYNVIGNSEISRQTLKYTANTQVNVPTQASIKKNPNVDYYFGAMGDYYMGRKLSGNSFSSNNNISEPQLRFDSSNGGESGLYFYSLTALNGSGNSSSFTPSTVGTGSNARVSFAAGQKRGTLPPTPTFENLLKSSSINPNNQTTYPALGVNNSIANNGSYVSYGISNSDSNYVIGVKNAKSVTLTYEGIMNGNIGVEADVVGETYNEWISFGVESEPVNYTFAGTVFNDNGGITNGNSQELSYVSNGAYFNGQLDGGEFGISDSNLRVRLTDCSANNNMIATSATTPNPQTINAMSMGKYRFTVQPSALSGNTTGICVVEEEPNPWVYTQDTTPNNIRVTFNSAQFDYTGLDFGEVTQDLSALALKKYQYVHSCAATPAYTSIASNTESAETGFSMKAATNVKPGMCIAYRIDAFNRGHVSLADIQIVDTLQKKSTSPALVESVFFTPASSGIPATLYKGNNTSSAPANIGENGTIISSKFTLTNTATSTSSSTATLYFNTKYGTTSSNHSSNP